MPSFLIKAVDNKEEIQIEKQDCQNVEPYLLKPIFFEHKTCHILTREKCAEKHKKGEAELNKSGEVFIASNFLLEKDFVVVFASL